MSIVPQPPTVQGMAYRVAILSHEAEAYEGVYVQLDSDHQAVHVFSPDGQKHYLSIPATMALVEWQDPAPLVPQPRLPPFGAAAFERMAEQVERLAGGMSSVFQGRDRSNRPGT